jgi:aminomethyltransferase
MNKKTPLYDSHVKAGAKMISFFGWDMPLHYGSQIDEHHCIRQSVGVFDVSHMVTIDILGPGARDYLRYVLANDVDKLKGLGKSLYSCILNHHGGIIDDCLVYFLEVNHYRMVVNAANGYADLTWLNAQTEGFSVGLHQRNDLAILAIQGPEAIEKTKQVLNPCRMDAVATLQRFECVLVDEWLIARTGYTGEDGFEIILPHKDSIALWKALMKKGVKPCGLGARDTLRLEAGLNLHGQDMDVNTTPLVANLAWTVAWEPRDRLFIGRASLELQKSQGVKQQLVGLVLQAPGVLRQHQKVALAGGQEGEITSGSFSPTLHCAIAFARIPATEATKCEVLIRQKRLPAKIVKPPFVKNGKKNGQYEE